MSDSNIPSRILIVEDEPPQRKIVKKFMEKSGFEVAEAKNGEEALKYFIGNTVPFDVVILDFLLPDMTGIDTLRTIRQLKRSIQQPMVIIYSAVSRNVSQEDSIKLDIFDIIQKGSMKKLLESVKSAVKVIKNKTGINKILAEILVEHRKLEGKLNG